MNRLKRTDHIIIAAFILLAALILASVLFHEGKSDSGGVVSESGIKLTYRDYNGKKIGVLTGTLMEAESMKFFPDSEYLYYDGYPNLNTALQNGIIDGYLGDEPALKSIHAEQPQIDYIKERLINNRYSFAFRKDEKEEKKLCEQLNQFLADCRRDGTLDEIDSIWFGADDSKKVVDMAGLTGENGTIHVVTTSTDEPFSYIKNGKNVGYDIDVAVRFCRAYGYKIEIGDVDFQARIPALASGKYEFTTSMNVTPEREEEVLFSDPVSEGGIVVAVREEDLAGRKGPDYTDYDGKKIGIITGTAFESPTLESFPNSRYYYFNNLDDISLALTQENIDGFIGDEPVLRMLCADNKKISFIGEKIKDEDYAFGFTKDNPKTEKLKNEFNKMLDGFSQNGTLDKMKDIWFGSDESKKKVELSGFKGEKINIVVNSTQIPFSYMKDGKLVGYAIDLVCHFCKLYGYTPVLEDTAAAAALSGLVTNKYDICASSLSVTEERKESIAFSDPIYHGGLVLAVRASDLESSGQSTELGFFESIKRSFVRNFVREDRYQLILRGLGTTCLITLFAVLFGSLLAFLICLFRRTDSILAGRIANFYVKLLQGTPMVVLLMILYYIAFAKTGMDAIWVAIIGFSLNFAAYASEILRSGIESVNAGQREAALALGFTENQAFFRFIFPQAAVRQMHVYRGEIITLLKGTSVVGYIAIQDLTKMSDIIRSRTYEAFFPLIVTAVIYFLLAYLISVIIDWVLRWIDPKFQRNRRKGGSAK